jgi:putative transport protein
MTSTASLQAALDVMKNKDPSIGYSIAYPFGVIGPILCIYFMTRIVKPKFPAKAQRFHMAEISIGQTFAGKKLEELTSTALTDVQVTMVRKGGRNFVPTSDTALSAGDAIFVVAEREDAIAKAAAQLGTLQPGRLASDRADLDYIRVFVGKASVVGVPLANLPPDHSGRVELRRLRFSINHSKGRASVLRSSHFLTVISTTDDQSQTSTRRYTQP